MTKFAPSFFFSAGPISFHGRGGFEEKRGRVVAGTQGGRVFGLG